MSDHAIRFRVEPCGFLGARSSSRRQAIGGAGVFPFVCVLGCACWFVPQYSRTSATRQPKQSNPNTAPHRKQSLDGRRDGCSESRTGLKSGRTGWFVQQCEPGGHRHDRFRNERSGGRDETPPPNSRYRSVPSRRGSQRPPVKDSAANRMDLRSSPPVLTHRRGFSFSECMTCTRCAGRGFSGGKAFCAPILLSSEPLLNPF